jgi:hypothetical protein
MATYYHTTGTHPRTGEPILQQLGGERKLAEKTARAYRRNTGTATTLLVRCDPRTDQIGDPDSRWISGLHYFQLVALPVPYRRRSVTP